MEIAGRKRPIWRSPQYQNYITRVIMNKRIKFMAVLATALGFAWFVLPAPLDIGANARKPRPPRRIGNFMGPTSSPCHDSKSKKGNLDLTSLKFDSTDPKS